MKNQFLRRMQCRLVCIIAGFVCCGTAMATEPAAWIGQANNAFAIDLYGRLPANVNLFFSPNSIQTALAMTYAGARGTTAEQMAKVLRLPAGGGQQIHADFGNFLKELNGAGGERAYELSVANALWGQQGSAFLPDFRNLLKTDYGAGLKELDFKTDSEGARKTINGWVEKQTRDKIKDLIAPGVLTSATRLVLTNAIYFKGTWTTPFEKSATSDEPFHISASRDVKLPMMRRTGHYDYAEGPDYQALGLPYAGNKLAMIILLPRGGGGLPGLEHELTPAWLSNVFANLNNQEVVVSIPKFKMEDQFELGPVLEAMGMQAAFASDADFSGMTGKKDLNISNVVHKAFVEVNEQGTEAAAATGVMMATMAAMPQSQPPVFAADHPFLCVIRDETSGACLFMGRLVEPAGQ